MIKKSKIAILAGGFGTRLDCLNHDIPKPMFLINDMPLLLHQVLECKRYGFLDITMFLYHRHDLIRDFFKDGSEYGVNINYIIEDQPRGTAGAILDGLSSLDDNFIVLCGDTYFHINLSKFFDYHQKKNSYLTLFTHPNSHPYDSDIIICDDKDIIHSIETYPHHHKNLPNLVSSGLYIFNRDILYSYASDEKKIDLSKHLIPYLINETKKVYSFKSVEYIKDMGTPDRLEMVKRDILNDKPNLLSDKNKRKAIFLDRDGTIIKENGYITDSSQVELFKFSSESIKKINDSGYICIIITNQPVIARGDITDKELKQIHNYIESKLGEDGAYVDDIFYCPHHPDSGYDGEIPHLKIKCECRKPGIKLIEDSIIKYNISREGSWFIGDQTSDILAGVRSKLSTILLKTGHAGSDQKYTVEPTHTVDNLQSAIDVIINKSFPLKSGDID